MDMHPASEAPRYVPNPDGTSRPETEEERIERIKLTAELRTRMKKINDTAAAAAAKDHDMTAISYTDYRPADRVLYTDTENEHHTARVVGRDNVLILIKIEDADSSLSEQPPFYVPADALIMIEKGSGHPALSVSADHIVGVGATREEAAKDFIEQAIFAAGAPQPAEAIRNDFGPLHMTLNQYQVEAETTAIYPGVGTGSAEALVYTLGNLASEGGEGIGHYVKELRKTGKLPTLETLKPETRDLIISELGDDLWQTAMAAKELGITLEAVALRNLDKLQGRQARGTINGSGDKR